MTPRRTALPSDLVQTRPGLGVLRLAALLAEADGEPDDESLDAMFQQMESGAFDAISPSEIWPELARGLMTRAPATMIRALRDCGALAVVLPEVASVFGISQMSDDPAGGDLGQHILAALAEAARCDAPLAVRFALLVMNVGKADSPREHLPVHYRHIERGRPRIDAICDRLSVPAACRELAVVALVECERVHRVSTARAGPVAQMLDRLGAFDHPAIFARLITLCACDYRAYGHRSGLPYPKAVLLDTAVRACAGIDPTGFAAGLSAADITEALQSMRAIAIAQAFRSLRWSDDAT